ncbi:hypothetical protein JW877_03505 [bacterium]|nr:hypothetical protein [bacterium]
MAEVDPYPYNFQKDYKWHFDDYPLDSGGIPFEIHREGVFYNPVLIAQFALANYEIFALEGNRESQAAFLRGLDWLSENAVDWANGARVWTYPFGDKRYNLTPPWISALAQGSAISVLVRGYMLTEDTKYKTLADDALIPFRFLVKERGICNHFKNKVICYEEYPTLTTSGVLNGFIFALFGLFDYQKYFMEDNVKQLFDRGVFALKTNLDQYDTGYWSRYDLYYNGHIAGRKYHEIHIDLLKGLSKITRENQFEEKARKWAGNISDSICKTKWFCRRTLDKINGY